MYKVMIVDDEPAIREGMTTLIDWETYGFTVCGTAANGREALAKAEELKPDLLLVDIRMPGMNGLELIERIRESNDQCHFLILSGYSDFEYARRAIGFRVDGYLLKPVNEDELCERLERIQESLIAEKEAHRQHDEDVAWRGEQLVKSVVTGAAGDGLSNELWQPIAKRLSLEWSGYRVALAEFDPGEYRDPGQINLIKRRWTKELQDGHRGFVFLIEPYIGILLRQEEGAGLSDAGLLRLLQANGYTDAVFVSVGCPVPSFRQARQSYESALAGLRHRFALGAGVIVNADEPASGGTEAEGGLSIEESAEHLFYAMDIGNKESAVRTIAAAAERMSEARLSEEAVKSNFAHMLSTALNKLAAANPRAFASAQSFSPAISDIFRQKSMNALVAHANRMIEETVRQSADHGPETMIKRIEDFIRRNYGENLKLETLAELFNYNSSYLGKLFKTHTGDHFNTYLDKVRIDKAKELLAQGLKVHQVAEKVGYASADYFHTKFKKYEGASPSAFKGKA